MSINQTCTSTVSTMSNNLLQSHYLRHQHKTDTFVKQTHGAIPCAALFSLLTVSEPSDTSQGQTIGAGVRQWCSF